METYKTLEQLAKEYNIVLIDTSALDASTAPDAIKEQYLEELKRTLETYSNILTIHEVREETYKKNRKVDVKRKKIPVHLLGSINTSRISNFKSITKYITQLAYSIGIIDHEKDYPYTDPNLAALALGISQHFRSTAFASSDRKLNSLVDTIVKEIKKGIRKDFPAILNRLGVYSFVQRRAMFIPYEQEQRFQ